MSHRADTNNKLCVMIEPQQLCWMSHTISDVNHRENSVTDFVMNKILETNHLHDV
ncbi:predicted protein [Botrytis cinerea T4]|uniref:Uncharacterized protein n=1 Tax=Botryotinia fuckeliana (strain T4) TaxID=999810 RepID=G2YZJ8_BOTF4|nr:predicted protein [Botrytis cinerea T4]